MDNYRKHSVSRSLLNITYPHAVHPLQEVEELFYFVAPTIGFDNEINDNIMITNCNISDLNQDPVKLRHNLMTNPLQQENYNEFSERITSTLRNTILNYEDKLFFNLLRYLTNHGISQNINQNKKPLIELLHSTQNSNSFIKNIIVSAKVLAEDHSTFTNITSNILVSKFCKEDELFLFFDDKIGCIIEETPLTLTATKEDLSRLTKIEAYESIHMTVTKPSKIMKIVIKTGELEKFKAILEE